MADEVKLYEDGRSPYVSRVKLALHLKGVKYESVVEDLSNKSADLLKYNPVYKKVPVLVHNGNPISESLVIIEYIDNVWKGVPILPCDPYEKADARFWAKFIADTCNPAIYEVHRSYGNEQAVLEANEKLQILENKLRVSGQKFFGGDNINLVDIAAVYIAYWPEIVEEAKGIKFFTRDKFPKVSEWADNFLNCQVVQETLPPRAQLLAYFKKRHEARNKA
ncbi:putative glutathione transferase [Helianthus annuus]|uniref:glutathione transferase n=1 Tax=Helianthus annuus TaxID=4232 RepID=A0A251V327_HELAN|nr:probable glutathione S-transferase [Helianthus annuus]KAF5811987.1 putative glutathione transferase [Helianthus annuus]KAJ0933103.1 putative glutathione transferase [Helianthus annuus]